MSTSEKASNDTNSEDSALSSAANYAWALPIMSIGYSGRGLVYVVVAFVSFWSLWFGDEAEGTRSALESLNGIAGSVLVSVIAAGLFSFAAWCFINSFCNLDAYEFDLKGVLARAGILIIGVVHLGLGGIAIAALGFVRSGGQNTYTLSEFMQSPAGPVAIGIVGASTIVAATHYFYKCVSQSYREKLQANHFTVHWNPVLRAGLAAQGVSLCIIGGLILYAAVTVDASKAGGLDAAFEWLHNQAYGRTLVAALCAGLLAFGLVCFVNAAFRIVAKADDGSVENLASKLMAQQS